MNSPREESLRKESILIENAGREGLEHRHRNDPDELAGVKDGAADRHVEPNSLKESDPMMWTSPVPPCHHHENERVNYTSAKGHNSTSSLEDRQTSAKRKNDDPEYPNRKRRSVASSGQKAVEGVWIFTIDENNNLVLKDYKNFFDFFEDNFNNTIKRFSLNEERRIFRDVKDVKDRFLSMLNKERENFKLITRKKIIYQHAYVFLKYKQKEKEDYRIDIKGPYEPNNKGTRHSEDNIIKDIKPLINDDLLEIWIYTLNNPCLGRGNHTPCMYNLILLSKEVFLKNPKIQIYIGFSQYYIFKSRINDYAKREGKQIKLNNSQIHIVSKNSDSLEADKEQDEGGEETHIQSAAREGDDGEQDEGGEETHIQSAAREGDEQNEGGEETHIQSTAREGDDGEQNEGGEETHIQSTAREGDDGEQNEGGEETHIESTAREGDDGEQNEGGEETHIQSTAREGDDGEQNEGGEETHIQSAAREGDDGEQNEGGEETHIQSAAREGDEQNEGGEETHIQSAAREETQERIRSDNEERLGQELNRSVVLTFVKEIQRHFPNVKFFYLDFEQWKNLVNPNNLRNEE